ncbi:TPA: hypothetical protein MB364_000862 [Klebsiella variicola subsp. variicola]|nr:hypothetical protein [Klebsiella variicola subsp. variicola]
MKRAILKVYGILTVIFSIVVIAIISLTPPDEVVGRTLVSVNVCNTLIWFVISFWARYLAKCDCKRD